MLLEIELVSTLLSAIIAQGPIVTILSVIIYVLYKKTLSLDEKVFELYQAKLDELKSTIMLLHKLEEKYPELLKDLEQAINNLENEIRVLQAKLDNK